MSSSSSPAAASPPSVETPTNPAAFPKPVSLPASETNLNLFASDPSLLKPSEAPPPGLYAIKNGLKEPLPKTAAGPPKGKVAKPPSIAAFPIGLLTTFLIALVAFLKTFLIK